MLRRALTASALTLKGVRVMSIEREEFEQAVTDRWSDSYSFTRFGDEDYYDEVLEGMWRGWQASRQEGEPIGFLQSSGVSQLSGGHPAKLYPIGATPSPFESSTLAYTHPASADVPEKWRTVMKELADDLESEIEARRSGDLDRRIERDLMVVKEARVLLDE
jgi:hypothetical protein